ncbi:MAG TPA: CBS domain-containing protein [Candidatus Doudnabacteria bacterium]|nr:CBS domain-containing protein [Candidatus Doudnabacteria bacterium]
MTAQEIMAVDPIILRPDAPVVAIMQLFRDNPNSGFVVVNEQKRVMGVVSKDDLFTAGLGVHIPTYLQLLEEARFAKQSQKELPYVAKKLLHAGANEVMNQAVYYAHADTPVEIVAAVLARGRQTIVPVVDNENQFMGVIESSDLLDSLAGGASAPQVETVAHQRPVDNELSFVRKDMSSRFSYIARSRAHLWFSTTIVLFVIGFGLGIIFIVNPQPIAESVDNNVRQLLEMIFGR